MIIACLIAFFLLVVAWLVLPHSGGLAEEIQTTTSSVETTRRETAQA